TLGGNFDMTKCGTKGALRDPRKVPATLGHAARSEGELTDHWINHPTIGMYLDASESLGD
ncbi:hypothetical protein TorRG33x02_239520, partial [Trema orientale]